MGSSLGLLILASCKVVLEKQPCGKTGLCSQLQPGSAPARVGTEGVNKADEILCFYVFQINSNFKREIFLYPNSHSITLRALCFPLDSSSIQRLLFF